MVIIGHARQDEDGGIQGNNVGDQTGQEIRTEAWYNRSGGWDVYLRPLDDAIADRAAAFVEQVCADDNFGYSQPNRNSGYIGIISNGGHVAGASGDFDCSRLVYAAYQQAGLPVGSGSTRSIEEDFVRTGKFAAHRERAYLESGALSQRGGLYLTAGKHVAMVLSNSDEAMPDGYESDAPHAPTTDVPPPYVEIVIHGQHGVRVRKSPVSGTKARQNAMFGEKLPYIETDPATGWHMVETDGGVGWVTYKPKYVRLVME